MAGRNVIKGITVNIGGDTTELGKALETVNKKADNLSSELGEINRQLKFDPKNTELLSQKQKVLEDAIGATAEKLDKLKEAEKQVQAQFERGDATEEQVRALKREIIATEGKMDAYKKAAKDTATAVASLGEQAENAGEQMTGALSAGLKGAAVDITVNIGGDTTDLDKALESVNNKANSLSSELDEINRQLKFDPKNTELLAQKQKVLGEAIGAAAEKLEKLEEAEKQVQEQFERGEVSEEQVRALKREIIATESQMEAYKKAIKDTANAVESLDDRTDSLSSELDEINRQLKFDPKNTELLAQKQDVLQEAIWATAEKLDKLKEAEKQVQEQFERGDVTEEQVRALKREIIATEGKMDAYKKAAKDAAGYTEELGKETKEAGEGFTVMKGAMANLVSEGVSKLASSMAELPEATREYRTDMGKLETAFETAGKSSEVATKTYKELQSILGDSGQAVEAANHLAQLAETEADLAKWTEIATGVYAAFGSSLPIENLTEAANETA